MPAAEHEHDWTVALRRKPVSPGSSNNRRSGAFEVICRMCGDDPGLDHQEIPAELRQIRGPYTLSVGIAAYIRHEEFHDGTGDT